MVREKKSQVWIETVIYTLIGLALIGIVLAIVTPQVNEAQDRIVVEQAIDALNKFDLKIGEALDRAPGNVRIVEDFTMKRGELYINATGDSIAFFINDLQKPYSEPGIPIEIGRITALSSEGNKLGSVRLTLDYSGVANITTGITSSTFSGDDIDKKFTATTTPYRFSIRNLGNRNDNGLIILNIEETSRG